MVLVDRGADPYLHVGRTDTKDVCRIVDLEQQWIWESPILVRKAAGVDPWMFGADCSDNRDLSSIPGPSNNVRVGYGKIVGVGVQ